MTGSRPEGKGWVERRYRLMLLAYPAQYRERHGGELLGTLQEARPSRRLPSLRESVGLLDAGVLTRLRARLDQVPAWSGGLQLGLLLLALAQAGTMLSDVPAAPHRPGLWILLPASLLVLVAMLLGRMGIAAVAASIPAALTIYQARPPAHGTDFVVGLFSSQTVSPSSDVHVWLTAGRSPFWLIAVGAAVLAVSRRTRGPLPRRSWWWLTVPLLEAAVIGYGRTLLPAGDPPIPAVPVSFLALYALPLIATFGLMLLALRATVAIGDARWAIAAGVYLLPLGVYAAALGSARPGAIMTLVEQLPLVLLTAASVVVLLRRAPRRAGI